MVPTFGHKRRTVIVVFIMQTQLARCVFASRACSNVPACMPSLSVSLSTLSLYLSDASPTETVLNLQTPSGHHTFRTALLTDIDRHNIDRNNCAIDAVPVQPQTFTPWMPAQLQAAVRLAEVQKLASIGSLLPGLTGLQGELPPCFTLTTCYVQLNARISQVLSSEKGGMASSIGIGSIHVLAA